MEDGLRDEGDGWFSTASQAVGSASAEDIPSLDAAHSPKTAGPSKAGAEGDDEDIPDIDDLELEDVEEDEVPADRKHCSRLDTLRSSGEIGECIMEQKLCFRDCAISMR